MTDVTEKIQNLRQTAKLFMLAPLLLISSACASWPERPEFSAANQNAAIIAEMPDVRFWANPSPSKIKQLRRHYADARLLAAQNGIPPNILALSGGADNGAYGAGLLAGWSKSGNRSEFMLVTGVSTGALIAPFAFLGSEYDDRLKRFYTAVEADDIYKSRSLIGALSGPSLLDSKPLQRLVAANIDSALLDQIAAEHRRGRRLLVMTTNLDAGRGVIWDMGAIAASDNPAKLSLFRTVITASASVPGLFTPVLIDAAANGANFSELHADGGTVSGFFILPETAFWADADQSGKANIYLILNGRLNPEFKVVEPKSLTLVGRALDIFVIASNRSSAVQTYNYAQRNNWSFRMSAIENDFALEWQELFEPEYMTALYDYGLTRGRDASHWQTRPVTE